MKDKDTKELSNNNSECLNQPLDNETQKQFKERIVKKMERLIPMNVDSDKTTRNEEC